MKPTQAYRDAGFAPGSSHASRLNGRPHIKDRISELRGHTAAVTNTTRESLMLDTIKAQAKAENEGHLVAWIRAIELRAKLAGLLVDRVAIDNRVHYAISDEPLTDEEWAAKMLRPRSVPAKPRHRSQGHRCTARPAGGVEANVTRSNPSC